MAISTPHIFNGITQKLLGASSGPSQLAITESRLTTICRVFAEAASRLPGDGLGDVQVRQVHLQALLPRLPQEGALAPP